MGRDKLRPCMIKIGFKEQSALFHRWYDSYAHGNPTVYGLVELEDGTITGVSAGNVRFTDKQDINVEIDFETIARGISKIIDECWKNLKSGDN